MTGSFIPKLALLTLMSCKLSRNLEPNFVVDDGNMGLYNTTLQVDKEYTNK